MLARLTGGSKSKNKDKKSEPRVKFEDVDQSRMSRSSKKSYASMSKYSSDPSAPPNFGGNINDDDDINDRSSNMLSYPTDVQGTKNRPSLLNSSANTRTMPVSRF